MKTRKSIGKVKRELSRFHVQRGTSAEGWDLRPLNLHRFGVSFLAIPVAGNDYGASSWETLRLPLEQHPARVLRRFLALNKGERKYNGSNWRIQNG